MKYRSKIVLGMFLALTAIAGGIFINFAQAANTHSLDLERDLSQYLDASDSASLSITGDLTIEAWVKFESTPASDDNYAIVTKWEDGAGDGRKSYGMRLDNVAGTLKLVGFAEISSGTQIARVNWSPSVGAWHHVAFTRNSSSGDFKFYIDGVQQGSTQSGTTGAIVDSLAKLKLGTKTPGSESEFFDGLIDDVRVWNLARTSIEISDDRLRELNGNEIGLVGYWKLNNSLLDTTINGNALTNNGSAIFSASTPFVGATESLKVRKASNESVTNSTILQNDDELKLVLLENRTYIVEGVIFASSTSAVPDITIAFFAPTGSTPTIGYTNDLNEAVLSSGATSTAIALPANTPTSIHIKGTIKTVGTSGDFQLKWSQSSANNAPTTVMQGSYLRAESI